MNRHENLAKISKDLMLKEPFYGLFLIMLNKVWTDKVPTAGVGRNGINFQLYINPEFWDKLTDIQKMGLLKHELLHMGFMHVTEFDHLTNKEVRNVAMDIEINQYIDESWLPEGGCTIKSVEASLGIKLKAKMGTKYYYDELMKLKGQMSKDLMKLIGDSHASWEEFDDMTDAEKKLIEKQVQKILQDAKEQTVKKRGNIPGEIEGLIQIEEITRAKFDWKGYIYVF